MGHFPEAAGFPIAAEILHHINKSTIVEDSVSIDDKP
jgi:hypothetical protein